MVLESTFRLASDLVLEDQGEAIFLFTPARSSQTPLKFPLELSEALKELRADFVTNSRMEDLITKDAPGDGLIVRYFYLQAMKKNGFLCERIGFNGNDLIEILPAQSRAPQPLPDSDSCKLSRFAYLHQENDTLVMESPLNLHRIVFLEDRLIRLVSLLSKGMSIGEIAERLSDFDGRVIRELVEILVSCSFAVSGEAGAVGQEDEPPLATWEFHDLLFQARHRMGRHRNPSGGTYRFLDTIPALPVIKPAVSENAIMLEDPDIEALEEGDKPFTAVLEDRMSIREFADTPISLSQLGELLFRTARIKYVQKGDEHGDVAFRPYPAGGAIHELEIYPLVKRCQGLDGGLYRYNPDKRQLEPISRMTEDLESIVWQAAAAMGKPEAKDTIQVMLLITSRFPRLSWKYQSMAYATTLKGLGCLYQTLYLVATAMDLAPCAIGAGDSELFAKATGINYYEEPLIGEFVVGRPRE